MCTKRTQAELYQPLDIRPDGADAQTVPMSPMVFLSTFILAYSRTCIDTDTRTVETFNMVESAKEAIYKEALKRGREEGYQQAMCEMQDAIERGGDVLAGFKAG